MASKKLVVEIIGDSSSLERALKSAGARANGFGSTLAKGGKIAAAGIAVIGTAAIVAGGKMIQMASDAAEVDSKLKVVFGKALPELSRNLDAFSEATGASRYALREQAADMGALLEPLSANKSEAAAMSEQFVKLATDLGSFNNVPVGDALLAIRSGLVGESEPLRRFGVLLNEAAVKAEGLRLGLVKGKEEMTEQEKVQARASLIMKQTTLAQGDATKTAGSMSNQMKALRNNISDAATSMGAMLIPYALAAVKAFNENWPTIEAVTRAVLTGVIAGIRGLATAINWLRDQWETHRGTVIATWNAIQSAVQGAINWFKANVVPAIQTVVRIATALWQEFGGAITRIARTEFGTAVTMIKTTLQNLVAPFKIILAILRGDWGAAWNEIKAIPIRTLGAVWTLIRGSVTTAKTTALALGGAIVDGVVEGLKGLVEKVGERFTWLGNLIFQQIGKAYGWAKDIGRGILQGIKDGFMSLWDGFVGWFGDRMNDLKNLGKKLLGISSPSKVFAEEIGRPMGEGIKVGWLLGTADLPDKISDTLRKAIERAQKAIQSQQSVLSAAWSRLASDSLRAFDAATDAGLAKIQAKLNKRLAQIDAELAAKMRKIDARQSAETPAERELRQLQEGKAQGDREQAIKDARTRLDEAQAGGDPEAILAAQKALDDALYAQQVADLEKRAELERKEADAKAERERAAAEKAAEKKRKTAEKNNAERQKDYQSERDLHRRHLEDWLEQQAILLEEHPKQWERIHKKLMRKFRDVFGPDFKTAGRNLGTGFAEGLNESLADMKTAAETLANLIAQYLKSMSPTEKGPLSTLDEWGPNLVKTYADGITKSSGYLESAMANITMRATGGFSGRRTLGVGGAGGGIGGGGTTTINVPVYLDGQKIAEVVTDRQQVMDRRGRPMPWSG